MDSQQKLLEAFQEMPTTYHVDVLDNTMLPENLKSRQKLSFILNPPTLRTLGKAGIVLTKIPYSEVAGLSGNELLSVAMKYSKEIVQIMCIFLHGKDSDYPEWYEPFLQANITPKEMYLMFQEVMAKSQISFFLTSFQIQGGVNPTVSQKT